MNAPSSTATIAETETYSKSAGLGRTGALPLAGLLKHVSENIVQTDNEVIVYDFSPPMFAAPGAGSL